MAGVLGKYEWLASTAIDLGFPIIGAALGVPTLAPMAAGMLKKALGMSDSASLDTLRNTIESDPEASKAAFEVANTEAAGKWDYLARAVEAQAKVNISNSVEVNKTIREEVKAGVSWYHWRHLIGHLFLLVVFEIALLIPFVIAGLLSIDDMVKIIGAMTPIIGILAGILGYVAQDTTNGKVAAITGEKPDGIIVATAKALGAGKKK